MIKKRFIRDNILDEMLEEIRTISGKTSETGFPIMVFSQAMVSLSDLYETNKIVLQRLEETIDRLRQENIDQDILDRLVEAAAHIQMGLVTVHNALKKDVQTIVDGLETFRKTLGIE